MIDETTGQSWESPQTGAAEPQPIGSQTTTAGFCQDCGRPLSAETIRTVGNAVFCESCLQVRLNPGAVPPPAGAPGYGTAVPPTSLPSPTVAGWIGIMPGAGAMYNGQYAKGFAHLLIFAVLANLGDHASGFGVLCFGWIVYMVFDAIYTARARRDGLPLPNPLQLNDIGERIAHGWAQNQQTAAAAAQAATSQPVTPPGVNWQPVPPAAQANWAGYVPPTAFGAPAATPYPPVDGSAYAQPGYVPPAASQPVVDPKYTWNVHDTPAAAQFPAAPTRRFPVAAVVLIGLGVLFLIGNVFPNIHLSGDTTTALVLGAVAIWIFYRRFTLADQIRTATGVDSPAFFLHMLRWPILLATVAVMFALHALGVLTPGQSFPLVLIVGGLLILVERLGLPHGIPTKANWNAGAPPSEAANVVPAGTAAQSGESARDSEVAR
jgi:hypothetical protein